MTTLKIETAMLRIETLHKQLQNAASQIEAEKINDMLTAAYEAAQNSIIERTDFSPELKQLVLKQRTQTFFTITRSVGGKYQRRFNGPRGVKNCFNHSFGSSGEMIDNIVINGLSGRFSKLEIAALAGTLVSKVNSHSNNELKAKFNITYTVNSRGKLEFSIPGHIKLVCAKQRAELGIEIKKAVK